MVQTVYSVIGQSVIDLWLRYLSISSPRVAAFRATVECSHLHVVPHVKESETIESSAANN